MQTPQEMQGRLLNEAIGDIQKVAKQWTDSQLERPVVFLVDSNDPTGAAFVENFVSAKDQYAAKVIQDGGVEAGCIRTVIKAMPLEWADKSLEQMATRNGQSLREVNDPNHITVIVVAFGEVRPYHVKASD